MNDYSITAKQREYIEILSSYPSTKEQDEADIRSFLKKANKQKVSQLSKIEASNLIQILLKRPTEYVFPCDKNGTFPKTEVNCYNVLGDFEGCLHACPDENVGGDVNNCPYWKGYSNGQREEFERYVIQSIRNGPCNHASGYMCENCGKYIIGDREFFHQLKEEFPNRIKFGRIYRHHTDYERDVTVNVCSSCHRKITNSPSHPLYPKDKPRRSVE